MDRRHAPLSCFGGRIDRESSCDISGHCLGGHRGAAGKAIAQAVYVIALTTALLLVTLIGRLDLQAIVLVVAGAYSLRTIMYFMLGAIAGTYDLHALRAHLAVAIMSVALSGALIGGSVALAHALSFSAIATVAVAITAGVGTLGLLFTADLLRLRRDGGVLWRTPRAEGIF